MQQLEGGIVEEFLVDGGEAAEVMAAQERTYRARAGRVFSRAGRLTRSGRYPGSRRIDAQRRVPCQRIEVGITVQNGQVNPDGQRADQTVHEDANGRAATAAMAIKGRRLIEVAGLHRNQRGTRDESPQIAPMLLVPCSGEQFHTNCITCREVGVEEFADSVARR